jgi:putative ABC transport system substrate-binding protein
VIRPFCLLGRLVYFLVCRHAIGGVDGVVVLYPETDPPYRAVFAEIISGIEQRLGTANVLRYALPVDNDLSVLRGWLEQQMAGAVITLGRAATQAYTSTGLKTPQVIGALDLSPQTRPDATGISLAVDPALLFATLKSLVPTIKRVFVVFNPSRERWIIERAQQNVAAHGLTLIPLEASDLRSSARLFLQIVETANPQTDALWLTMDSQIFDTEAMMPMLIEQSWNRRLVVFSSSLEQANLGVLFALYPDNQALGRRLAELALQLTQRPGRSPGIEPLRAIKRALNLRAATHLNLAIDKSVERQFDLIFPSK